MDDRFIAITQHAEASEARSGGGDLGGTQPTAVRVGEEIGARGTRRIHVRAVDRRRLSSDGGNAYGAKSRRQNDRAHHVKTGWNYKFDNVNCGGSRARAENASDSTPRSK